jgi:hypothetical protein
MTDVLALCVSVASVAVSCLTVHYARAVGRERKRLQQIRSERERIRSERAAHV